MDTRLVELLLKSMNLRNGDIKIVKVLVQLLTIHLAVLCSLLAAILNSKLKRYSLSAL